MSDISWRPLDEDEYKQLVAELETRCITPERVGYVTYNNGAIHPSIKIDERVFKKLVQAGEIDVTSRISTITAGLHFYVKLEINWKSIHEDLTIFFNGWRDRSWLELLCVIRKVAFTTQDFKVAKPLRRAIVVDGINVDKLRLILATTSLFCFPKDIPMTKK